MASGPPQAPPGSRGSVHLSTPSRTLPPPRPPRPPLLLRADSLCSQHFCVSVPQRANWCCAEGGGAAGPASIRGHNGTCPLQQCRRTAQTADTPNYSHKSLLGQLPLSVRMACCVCCCPVFRCVLWFCALEIVVSVCFWYDQLSDLFRTFRTSTELTDVLLFLVLTGWLVTLGVSTVSLWLAERKRDPQWVLPRLVQQSGLLVLAFLGALLLVVYFSGGAQSINSWLISVYETLFSDPLDLRERQDAHESLRFHFLFMIVLDFALICYLSCALCATKKYYRELQNAGRTFQRVAQNAPSAPAPQPPVNPHYKGSV